MTTDTPSPESETRGEEQQPRRLHVGDELLARLLRTMADAALIADREGEIVFWNEAAERLFGWPATEAVGANLDLIIPERLRQRHWDGWQTVMRTGETRYGEQLLEVPAAHRDGRRLSIAFTVSLLTDADGAVSGVAAVIRDDTERWQQRREARAELVALRAALDAAGVDAPSAEGADAAPGTGSSGSAG